MAGIVFSIFSILYGMHIYLESETFFFKLFGGILVYAGISRLMNFFQGESDKRDSTFYRRLDTENLRTVDQSSAGSRNWYYIIKLKELFAGRDSVDILTSIIAAAGIHSAKSDGNISEKEIEAIRSCINRNFPGRADHSFIAEAVRITKRHLSSSGQHNIPVSCIAVIELYLELISYMPVQERQELTLLIFTILHEVAIADQGRMTSEKTQMFFILYQHFGISADFAEIIRRTAEFNAGRRQNFRQDSRNAKIEEALKFFGLNKDYTRDELDRVWKKNAMMYHPDRYHSSSPEIHDVMKKKFQDAKEFYDLLSENIKNRN